MKRSFLVDYTSSEGEDDKTIETSLSTAESRVPKKKLKTLPALSQVFLPIVPIDNPAEHQGRVRGTPYVEGQWCAHVYVSVGIPHASSLGRLLHDVLRSAQSEVPCMKPLIEEKDAIHELHISLSRPIYLRAHQREDLKKAVRTLGLGQKPFIASFASFCELTNDDKTRTFLAMEVGAGHAELHTIADRLTPILRAIRQREFYDNPRFHSSLAWALLDQTPTGDLPTVSPLGDDVVGRLNKEYGKQLAATHVSMLQVSELTVKIGKEVSSWWLGR